jgi:hypothetical protein
MNDSKLRTRAREGVRFGPGISVVDLPAGLRVKQCSETGQTKAEMRTWFVEEFPEEVFPRDSLERHDAIHYGIRLNRGDLEEVTP